MKIIKWCLGFPILTIMYYWLFVILIFGVISLGLWDISPLIDNLKFWVSNETYGLGRTIIWILSLFFSGGVIAASDEVF